MKSKQLREIIRAVIWEIAQNEGGHILHYNEWVDDNWEELVIEAEKVSHDVAYAQEEEK